MMTSFTIQKLSFCVFLFCFYFLCHWGQVPQSSTDASIVEYNVLIFLYSFCGFWSPFHPPPRSTPRSVCRGIWSSNLQGMYRTILNHKSLISCELNLLYSVRYWQSLINLCGGGRSWGGFCKQSCRVISGDSWLTVPDGSVLRLNFWGPLMLCSVAQGVVRCWDSNLGSSSCKAYTLTPQLSPQTPVSRFCMVSISFPSVEEFFHVAS